ncbi:FAD-binding oxidoreductase [filamentous cyanobacterium LEGE 11480]|uniref:FAD-binding oxidoreductase n=1 Tax=Romeriopsis navalis LEGE 11480 TaxID=2777977 RepID=A0A928VTQ9_9CYAN|nr:FAD-binding oxidoreductase [Romeriopsis navalis]MBE9031899.1 FAD-binding oxidoreductase [Romeriopsis navalis LEGE 11480]
MSSIDWLAFSRALDKIQFIEKPKQVKRLSQDYYHFSPILQDLLADKQAKMIVQPKSEAEVITVVAACVQQNIPLTVRGAGTGNYGQCIPLEGGIVLDMSLMNKVDWFAPGVASVQPGVKLVDIDRVTRPSGWEIRMAPSTYRTATIGGFIGGGSGGIGSVTYGQLRDRGNLRAVRVVTMEDQPQVLELRGDEVYQVAHAYGTNGIITELEIPLAPAYAWAEVIVTFDDFMQAARFGQALGDADGLIKKLVTVFADPIPSYFAAFQDVIPSQSHCAFLMVSEESIAPLQELVREFQGSIVYEKSAEEASRGVAIYEYTWNHTTLHARAIDPNITYLQTLFPGDHDLNLVEHMYRHFGDEVMMHLEFMRVGGRATPAALQLLRYSTPERLQAIIQYHESQGAIIFNPHTYLLEDGGMKQVDVAQLRFKEKVDPYGLMNPGKMRAWQERWAEG